MPMREGYTGLTDKIGEEYEKDLCNKLIRNFEKKRGDRGTLDAHCQEIAARIVPMQKRLWESWGYKQVSGEKLNQEVLDSTGTSALNKFVSILDSLLTPRNAFWHQLRPSNNPLLLKDKNTMDYFTQVNTILFEQRYNPKANFAGQNQGVYLSLGAYGTGALFIDDLAGERGLRYRNCHLSEVYPQENHQGLIDGCDRYFCLTARQASIMFGDNCPKVIQEKCASDPEFPYYFIHVVIPRTDRDPERKDFKGMQYASYYISMEGKQIVAEGGYNTFPYSIPRYNQVSPDVYGRSIAMDVLPAIKTLNKQKELVLKQGQLAVDPVILLHDDGIMDGASIESGTHLAGAVSADGRPLAQTLPFGRVDIGKDLMDDERLDIKDAFLLTIFQILVETPEMTATEAIERAKEKSIILTPPIGRLQSEYLGGVVPREIDILSRQGQLPPMPRFLRDAQGEYEIVYDSPITRSQKSEWVAGTLRSADYALNLAAQMQDPSYLDYFNWHEIIPQAALIQGTPSTWMNTPEQVAQIRAGRAKQQQVQQTIDAAPAAAGILKAIK